MEENMAVETPSKSSSPAKKRLRKLTTLTGQVIDIDGNMGTEIIRTHYTRLEKGKATDVNALPNINSSSDEDFVEPVEQPQQPTPAELRKRKLARKNSTKQSKSGRCNERKRGCNQDKIPKQVRRKRSIVDESILARDNVHPSLKTRTTPSALFERLANLNENQKEAIRQMGFHYFLDLKIKMIPGKLAYWVLERFDAHSMELDLGGGKKIKIDEDDVYRVLGFPRGNKSIKIIERTGNSDLFEQWVSLFGKKSKDDIKIGHVLDEMESCIDGGTWFKRHFVIALAFSIIESCGSGTVHPYVMNCLGDMSRISQWNWGEYLIKSLINHRRSWAANKKGVYVGPTLFLVLLYVDRYGTNGLTDRRSFPVFLNWTSEQLRDRERLELDDGYLGEGSVRPGIQLPPTHVLVKEPQTVKEPQKAQLDDGEEDLGRNIMKQTLFITDMIEKLKKMIECAPVSELRKKTFKDGCVAAKKNLGITIEGFESWYSDEFSKGGDDVYEHAYPSGSKTGAW